MANLIDRDVFEVGSGFVPEGYDVESYMAGNKEILEMIDAAPTVDAVPIVRCGECIHSSRSPFGHPVLRWCPLRDSHRSPDWFCADGKRKGEKG